MNPAQPPALTAELMLAAYAAGIFPMAESRDDPTLVWVDPRQRGVLPLEGFHISRSLARRLRRGGFTITLNTDFAGVIDGCADRPETWINPPIRALCLELHAMGAAHSLEVREGGALVGGVYGIAQGGAFFAESMFSRVRDASKIALAYLVDRLRRGGFVLLDTQFLTPHLQSLGGVELSRMAYRRKLAAALTLSADFMAPGAPPRPQDLLQRSTHTS